MAIEKKTVIDQIEITRSGHVQIRFGLLLLEYGNEIDCKWHRTAIEPGGDVDEQIAAVDTHLQAMGKAAIDLERINQLKSIVGVVHTPKTVNAYRAKLKAQSSDAI